MHEPVGVIFNKDFLPMTIGIRNPVLLQEIYLEYAQSLRHLLGLLQAGTLDPDKLYIEVHKLKSSSASVGATLLADKLVELDRCLLAAGPVDAHLQPLELLCQQTLDVVSLYADSLTEK